MTAQSGQGDDRQVVPRWRSFLDTVGVGELHPLLRTITNPSDGEIDRAYKRAQDRPSVYARAELLSTLTARGDFDAARLLASELDGELPETLQRFASRLIDVHEGGPRDSAYETGQFDASDFAVALGTGARQRLQVRPNNPTAWADLALAHTIQGYTDLAEKEIGRALNLAPDSRFVLRAAARLYVHLDKPDHANRLLNKSPRVRQDPWLLAAELSTAQLAFGKSKNILVGRELVESSQFSPHALSELMSELATTEMHSGRDRRARELFRRSFDDPTENAVAQAVSWSDRSNVELAPNLLRIDGVFEARALEDARGGHWDAATAEAAAWHRDQPFSIEPFQFGSYTASLGSGDFDRGARIAIEGLRRHPDDRTLRNNAAYSLANLDRTVEARKYVGMPTKFESVDDLIDLATTGLIHYRELNPGVGSSFYQAATTGFAKLGRADLAAVATTHWAIEELRLNTVNAPRLAKRAGKLLPQLPPAERRTLAGRLEAAAISPPIWSS